MILDPTMTLNYFLTYYLFTSFPFQPTITYFTIPILTFLMYQFHREMNHILIIYRVILVILIIVRQNVVLVIQSYLLLCLVVVQILIPGGSFDCFVIKKNEDDKGY